MSSWSAFGSTSSVLLGANVQEAGSCRECPSNVRMSCVHAWMRFGSRHAQVACWMQASAADAGMHQQLAG